MAHNYYVRRHCDGDGGHYFYETQETIDPDMACPTHPGGNFTGFAIIEENKDGNDFVLSFAAGNIPYAFTVNTSVTVITRFVFRGTKQMGIPSKIKLVACVESGGQGDLRIYDYTNAETIAAVTNITNTGLEIIDMGSLSNLPEDMAILEVSAKSDVVSKKIMVGSLILGY